MGSTSTCMKSAKQNNSALDLLHEELTYAATQGQILASTSVWSRYQTLSKDEKIQRYTSSQALLDDAVIPQLQHVFDFISINSKTTTKEQTMLVPKKYDYSNASKDPVNSTRDKKLTMNSYQPDDGYLSMVLVSQNLREDIINSNQCRADNMESPVIPTNLRRHLHLLFDEPLSEEPTRTDRCVEDLAQAIVSRVIELPGKQFRNTDGMESGQSAATNQEVFHTKATDEEIELIQKVQDQLNKQFEMTNNLTPRRTDKRDDGISDMPEDQVGHEAPTAISLSDETTPSTADEPRCLVDVVASGNITEAERIISDMPDDQAVTEAATAISEAIESNDFEMLEIILNKYHSSLMHSNKPLDLNDSITCLSQSIIKDNSLMVKVISDNLISDMSPTNTKLTGSSNIYTDLLVQSIQRGCRLPIISSINKLWQQSLKPLSSQQYFDEYSNLLAKMRPFKTDKRVQLYAIIGLGLLAYDRSICKRHFSDEYQSKLKNLDKIVSYSVNPRLYFNFLFTNKLSITNWQEWNNRLTRFSCHHSFGESPIDQQNICKMLIAEIDSGSDQATDETARIKQAVQNVMDNLCFALGRDNPAFKCLPELVGSAKEKTRCFYPNEYDYLLVFEILETQLEMKQHGTNFVYIIKDTIAESQDLQQFACQYNELQYLNPDMFKQQLNNKIESIVSNDFTSLWRPLKEHFSAPSDQTFYREFSTVSRNTKLTIEPVGFFTEKAKFSTLNLTWRGNQFKDMPITVDIVPVIKYVGDSSVPTHDFLEQYKALYVALHGYPVGFQIAFSACETDLILSLPVNIRRGYMYAKAVRCAAVLQQVLPSIDNFHDLITTYMLKTTLFFLTQHNMKDFNDDDPPIAWSIIIYERLRKFLNDNTRIPHFFLNNDNLEDGECLFKLESKQLYLHKRQLDNMLRAIETILELFQTFQHRIHSASDTFASLTGRTLHIEKRVDLKSEALSLCLINNKLYSCEWDGIDIYTTDLEHVRNIPAGEMKHVCGVAELPDHTLTVAAYKGLFHVANDGKVMEKIAGGSHNSVRGDGDTIIAATWHNPPTITTYSYSSSSR